MATLVEVFEQLRKQLEMKADLKADITRQQTWFREQLQKLWPGAQVFYSGSFGRSTKIEPIQDVDLFVVRAETFKEIGKIRLPSQQLLDDLYTITRSLFPSGSPRLQTRSVGVQFPGFRMDLVPAFGRADGGYFIADRKLPAPGYRFTNPKAQQAFTREVDQKFGQMAVPLVKMMKVWNQTHRLGLKSFHLEVMVLRALSQKPENYPVGAQAVLEKLQYAVRQSCGDSGNSGGRLDEYLSGTDREKIALRAKEHAETLKRALAMAQLKQHGEAIQLFHQVFGPVRG